MQTFNAYTQPTYTPVERECPICHKLFYPENAMEWVYKLKYKDNPDIKSELSKWHYFCSWTCFRKEDKHQEVLENAKKHPNAKLTDEQKEHIKTRIKENNALPDETRLTSYDLAKELEVSPATIRKYISIINWSAEK